MKLIKFVCAVILSVQQAEPPQTEAQFLPPCSEKEVSEIQSHFSLLEKPVQYPIPTKEQEALIQQLGADKFAEREEASKKFREMGLEGVLLLEKVETKNKEIKKRIELIAENYYDVYFREEEIVSYDYNESDQYEPEIEILKVFPSIWCLNNEWRFQGDKDISKIYFEEAKNIYNAFAKPHYNQLASNTDQQYPIIKDEVWQDEKAEQIAIQLLVIDLLRHGATKSDVAKLLAQTEFNSGYMERELWKSGDITEGKQYNELIPKKFTKQKQSYYPN